MKIEVHVFLPYQGQLRCRYDSEASTLRLISDDSMRRIMLSDPAYDKLVIENHANFAIGRPITCTELAFSSLHREKWVPLICDIIEEQITTFFAQSKTGTLYTHVFGPGMSIKDNETTSIIGTFCLVSK